jgi:hypothetical protein
MPLAMKTLQEASRELGIPEAEIKAMADMKKVRAIIKRGSYLFAPDEIAKIKRLRRSLPESAVKALPEEPTAPTGAPAASKPTTRSAQPRRPRRPPGPGEVNN